MRRELRRSSERWMMMSPGLATGALLLTLFYSSVTAAQGLLHYDASLGTDYRRAQLDWNIAGTLAGTVPNILSELTWHDLEIAQVNGAVQVSLIDRIVLRGSAAYGVVVNGKVQDSDYNGDNRSLEFLRSDSKAEGQIADGSIGLGYHFRLDNRKAEPAAQVTPMVGYSRHIQYLKITDGKQIIPATGPIANLNSKYDADWSGPWFGVDLRLNATKSTAVMIDAEYHWADFYAEANWNLRDDLAHPVSFRHDSRGFGFIASLALSHAVNQHWEVLARMESQNWQADPGIDTLYTINAKSKALEPTVTRLNGVRWQSLSAGAAVTYHF